MKIVTVFCTVCRRLIAFGKRERFSKATWPTSSDGFRISSRRCFDFQFETFQTRISAKSFRLRLLFRSAFVILNELTGTPCGIFDVLYGVRKSAVCRR